MEKVIVRVTSGPFSGLVGELVDGSVTIEIFGRECNIGCPEYVVQSTPISPEIAFIDDRVILEISHAKHGFYS